MVNIKTRAYGLSIVLSLFLFLILGSIASMIKNPFFIRMTEVQWYDYLFLALTSILSGAYAGLWYYKKETKRVCTYVTTSSLIGGVFSFGCAICNKLLVFLLGLSGVITYFVPLQPLLGVVSVSLLSYGVYQQMKL